MKPQAVLGTLLAIILLDSCRHQPKAVSKDYTKVTVSDSGHRDSVVNNKQRLYNASIPDPCLKCIIAAVRNTDQIKKFTGTADSSQVIYQVDWASGPKLDDSVKKAGSGLLIHVYKKGAQKTILAAFAFDNVIDQLYLINDQKQQQVPLDSATRIKIRRACFWGVASGK
jgi:TATA-binding protein-associated factor Taf7